VQEGTERWSGARVHSGSSARPAATGCANSGLGRAHRRRWARARTAAGSARKEHPGSTAL